MIREDYVSFETAKLLKEKGFDAMCQMVYTHDGESKSAINFIYGSQLIDNADIEEEARYNGWIPYIQSEYAFLCPTIQMAMKWLREVYNIHISVNMGFDVDNSQYFFYVPSVCRFSNTSGEYKTPFDEKEFDSYEEAVEAAIKYCLENLI